MQSVKDLRDRHGLSRVEFCEVLQIPYRTVQAWELGLRSCPDYVFRMMETVLDVNSRSEIAPEVVEPVEKPVETVENSGYNDNC